MQTAFLLLLLTPSILAALFLLLRVVQTVHAPVTADWITADDEMRALSAARGQRTAPVTVSAQATD